MKESFSEKIKKDIQELADKNIFKSMYFCPYVTCHAYKRHYMVSKKSMLKRVQDMKGVHVSRFYQSLSEDDIAGLVYEALSKNYKKLESGLCVKQASSDTFEIIYNFDYPIGEGCSRETGARFFQMSRLCIVIGRKPLNGRSFSIISFYPEFDMDEIDYFNDVIDGLC